MITACARRRPLRQRQPLVLIADTAIPGNLADLDDRNAVVLSGVSASAVIRISKHTGMTYRAWSKFSSDAAAHSHGQSPWFNELRVTKDDGTVSIFSSTQYESVTDAENDFISHPVTLTGSTTYKLWLWDDGPSDNRGGLSVMVEVL